jgi:hypothetical protein
MMTLEAIVFGLVAIVVIVVFLSVCMGISCAFWRLVDRIFGPRQR